LVTKAIAATNCAPRLPNAPKRSSLPNNRKVKIPHDLAIFKQRNIIERMFCRLKDWRRVALRFVRNIKTFMATIAIAATVIWWL